MPFYRSDLDKHIKIIQKDIGNVIADFATKAQKNLELTQGQSVQEYNRQCQALNRDTIEYNLLFVLSQSSKVEETESLNSLFQYSTRAGILIWVVSDTLPATNDTFVFKFPFEGVRHPIREQDNRDWCAISLHHWLGINLCPWLVRPNSSGHLMQMIICIYTQVSKMEIRHYVRAIQ